MQTATDATGVTLTYAYTDLNHLASVTYPDGTSETYTYSGCCPRLVDSVTDRAGRTTSSLYDALQRLTDVILPDPQTGGAIHYGYDANGNLISLTDPKHQITAFAYDLDNRLTRTTYHDSTFVEWAYTPVGLVAQFTNARGDTIRYGYDANDNLTAVTYSDDDTPHVSYTYDASDRPDTMTDGLGLWEYGYDANSQLISVDGPWDADTITYGYDDLGRLTTMTPQGGTPLTYLYDSLNRLTQIQLGSPGTAYSYTYPGASPLVQSLLRPNGSVTTYQYNLLTRLTDIANTTSIGTVITQHTFTYNLAGLRDSETMTGVPELPTLADEDTTSTYNTVNHLTVTTNPARPAYTYDEDGNMTQGYTPLLEEQGC